MNLIKSISNLFGKKSKSGTGAAATAEVKAARSVELNMPNAKVKRRKQKRGY
ncbi:MULTISPECIES: hypothetical protein [Deefgea]|uniref:Uncharacterized protein n=1 Tax=Deefgea chitinilytica TaxID=570276 RepID=A0ABS2C926_9NEIS|nr:MULTISPECIES: hypothetical protein [Deefgea]MBM5570532.1 hypothetical protein [Deefgea chitinilytica]MBM9887761.1 hypothetical protein [Deefgea sp. CFH1-16]